MMVWPIVFEWRFSEPMIEGTQQRIVSELFLRFILGHPARTKERRKTGRGGSHRRLGAGEDSGQIIHPRALLRSVAFFFVLSDVRLGVSQVRVVLRADPTASLGKLESVLFKRVHRELPEARNCQLHLSSVQERTRLHQKVRHR